MKPNIKVKGKRNSEDNDKIYQNSVEKQKRIWEALFFTQQRVEVLLITFGGAGLYVCIESLKEANAKKYEETWMIKCAAIFILLSIAINFLSQFLSIKSQTNDFIENEIAMLCTQEEKDENKDLIKKYRDDSEYYNSWVEKANIYGAIIMFIGYVFLIAYYNLIF